MSTVTKSECGNGGNSFAGLAHQPRELSQAQIFSLVSHRTKVEEQPKLNRVAEVRKNQGLSEKSLCKRLNIDLKRLHELENPTTDLTISELMAIQAALDVPLVDLLEDNNSLARPIHERAKLVRVMKTSEAIRECSLSLRATRLAEMLRDQLVDLMPELAQVGSWPQFGSRRSASSVARVLASQISLSQIQVDD